MCEKCEGVLSMRIRGRNQAISREPRARRQGRVVRETRAVGSEGGMRRREAVLGDGGGRGEGGGRGSAGRGEEGEEESEAEGCGR